MTGAAICAAILLGCFWMPIPQEIMSGDTVSWRNFGIKCSGSGTHLWHMFPCFVSAACDIFCHSWDVRDPQNFRSCQPWADMFLAKHVQSRVHLASKASHGKCLENSKVHWFLYLMMLEADCFDGKRVSNGSDRNQNHLWFAIQFA